METGGILASNELISLSQIIISGTFRFGVALKHHRDEKKRITVINGDRIFPSDGNSKVVVSFHKNNPNKKTHYLEIIFDPPKENLGLYRTFFDKQNNIVAEKNKQIKKKNKPLKKDISRIQKTIKKLLECKGESTFF